jgi:hypothetical protein
MESVIDIIAPHGRITPFAAFHATGEPWIRISSEVLRDSGDDVTNMSFETDPKLGKARISARTTVAAN